MIESIFVRAMSRSGGTLTCAILDSHPDISMSYELYPWLLETDRFEINKLIESLRLGVNQDILNNCPTKNFERFLHWMKRGGITNGEFADILESCNLQKEKRITKVSSLQIIKKCGILKKEKESKSIWGMKMLDNYSDYQTSFKHSFFIYVVRDGRDVFASQMNTGSFNPTPEKLAEQWVSNLETFNQFMAKNKNAILLKYENLVRDTENVIKNLTQKIGINFSSQMIMPYKNDLCIFTSDHISKEKIQQPINDGSIGRWRKEVNQSLIKSFMNVAGPQMKKLNYTI